MNTLAAPQRTPPVHQPLATDAALLLLPQACLAVRAGEAACSACRHACPAHALVVDHDGPRLAGDCLHCGQCAAACPSGALRVVGFMERMLPAGEGPVEVECAKAPAVASSQALRVPCLGGITPALLLRWWLAAGDRPLTLVNRGGCAGCSAGGEGFAAQALLQQVGAWLNDCGAAPERWPASRCDRPSAQGTTASVPVPLRPEHTLSRRGFFRRLGTEVGRADPVATLPAGPRAPLRREPCALPERQALLNSLQVIAERQGRTVPASVLPALTVAADCGDHGLCAGVCPTGALQREEHEGSTQLCFDARRCVSCRRCVDACPEQALRLATGGSIAALTVRRTPTRPCIQCGRPFATQRPGALCTRCAADTDLARSMFGTSDAGH